MAAMIERFFLLANQRLARANNLLFVLVGLTCKCLVEEIKICLTHRLCRVIQTARPSDRLVDA